MSQLEKENCKQDANQERKSDFVDTLALNPSENNLKPSEVIPARIGRFRVESILGRGGFGVVYLAFDEQLERRVAIKLPHPRFVQRPEDREIYIKEARMVASLEHPNIVPVHEVGSTPEYPVFIVSKYIVGHDLATQLKRATPSYLQATQWIIELADALRAAHKQGIVHRDIKPPNTLIDREERVYLLDFGLALRDEDVGKQLLVGGTPAYMSPEQARGEGHRVDGRSDIFSLGIMFYELLTGRRPFHGDSQHALFEQITELDPKPLRQWNELVPQELDRICFKMLAKRKSERYSSAMDLVDDLQAFLANSISASLQSAPNRQSDANSTDTQRSGQTPTPHTATPTSGSSPLKIIPKGLRSFDQRDADFFLELLPGPRDRNGLPESVGFWKSRLEERDADQTFAVGLLYGPSGCGKSSMMKAGLLPRLSPDIIAIYLEATVDDTERTLLAMIRKKLGSTDAESTTSLVDLLHEVRLGRILPRGKKLVIVIDQFEQWLFAHSKVAGEPLLESLLQCDGARVQAIVMVRDDFWMAATRFFRDLDIPLLERINSAAVDLFDVDHAERVLKAFGRAFGKLASDGKEDRQDRKQFITEAVNGMSEENKVVSVRLSLFAEMMKGRPWTPESLREVGGTTGVGTTFLEETFSASGAPPQHRYHQEAARSLLRALMPQAGTEMKGSKRSANELRAACQYNNRQRDFDDLIRILDKELRLITPTDPEGSLGDSEASLRDSSQRYYQLTHDYLVPSLRDWLTRKQKETRRGRAELRLAERAGMWSAKRENRYLPSFFEFVNIAFLTDRNTWTNSQGAMMTKSRQFYAFVGSGIAILIVIAMVGWFIKQDRQLQTDQRSLLKSLAIATIDDVPGLLKEIKKSRVPKSYIMEELESTTNPDGKLKMRLALVEYDEQERIGLLEELLRAEPVKVPVIGDVLASNDEQLFVANLLDSVSRIKLAPVPENTGGPYKKERILQAQKLANVAIAALRLGAKDGYLEALQVNDDPEVMTQFIHRCRTGGVLAIELWNCVSEQLARRDKHAPGDRVKKNQLLFGLLLALGEFPNDAIDADMVNKVASLFKTDPSAAVHGATGWLLRHWQRTNLVDEIERTPANYDRSREWFRLLVDAGDRRKFSYTFVVFPAGEYTIGSQADEPDHDEDERLRDMEIAFPFALLDREITVRELLAFDPNFFRDTTMSLDSDSEKAGGFVSWDDSANFCKWLTEHVEIVGSPVAIQESSSQSPQINRFDFRLPHDAEWEIACRGGMRTMFSCGSDVSLLKHYAWYDKFESGIASRTLRPNFCGLFDMHGNVFEWCNDDFESWSDSAIKASTDTTEPQKVLRSGAWHYAAVAIRSANRSSGGRNSPGLRSCG
ncbi:MAG: protein kinase, partial [Pirellula sp.]